MSGPRWALVLALAAWVGLAWLQALGVYAGVEQVRGGLYRVLHRGGSEPAGTAPLQAQLASLQEENQRLRQLLKLPRQGWRLALTANCLYRDSARPQGDLWLDRGSADGVNLRTVALHGGGLVGRIVELRPHRSRLRPLLDSQSRVPVLFGKTGLQGVAHGRGWLLEVEQVRSRPPVEPGTWVVTSGLGEIYPGSVLVGQVRRSLSSSEPMFARYEVEPSVLLDQVLEVLLIEREPPSAP